MNNKELFTACEKYMTNLSQIIANRSLSSSDYETIATDLATKINQYGPDFFIFKNSFIWLNYVENKHEDFTTVDMFYPSVLAVMLKYVEDCREFDELSGSKTTIKDAVLSFADKCGIDVEVIGDICSYDVYFKKFIENESNIYGVKDNKSYHPDLVSDLFNW